MQHGGRQLLRLPAPQAIPAADLFPDGAFVRLMNRAQGTYLHADEDGEGVSLSPHGVAFSVNKVWRVHRVEIDGVIFVLLQGVAYGRYLASSLDVEPGCVGHRAVQRDYDGPNMGALIWRPLRKVEGEGYVRLRQDANRNLRANGRFRFWKTAVTVDANEDKWTTMMQWTVHRFELAPGLPPLPHPTVILGGPRGLFQRRTPEADQRRTIWYVRANDEGVFDQNQNSENWRAFPFYGRSVFNLMAAVVSLLPRGEVGAGITLAVRPGLQGRLTPLVTDLPRSVDPMNIVVFKTGSQGAQNFVYPDIP